MQAGSTDAPKDPPPLLFVQVRHPSDAKASTFRKSVRSHVTKAQHRLYKAKHGENKAVPRAASKASSGSRQPVDSGIALPDEVPASLKPKAKQAAQISELELDGDDEDTAQPVARTAAHERRMLILPKNATARGLSHGTTAFSTFALHDRDNTFGTCIDSLGYDASTIMSYYRRLCCVQADDIKTQFKRPPKSRNTGDLYLSFVYQHPVLLSVVLVNTVQLLLQGSLTQKASVSLLTLKDHIIRSLNEALQSPVAAIADQVLIAVALCATHEAKHGSVDHYRMHMKGLSQIVSMKGGLSAVSERSSYHNLKQLLTWLDVNAAAIVNGQCYLRDQDDAHYYTSGKSSQQPQANPDIFCSRV